MSKHVTKTLPCRLTDAERMDWAERLSRLLGDMTSHELEEAATKAALKEKRGALTKQVDEAARVLREGTIDRLVSCTWIHNLESGRSDLVRDDTGESVDWKMLTEGDYQMHLFAQAREEGIPVRRGESIELEDGRIGSVIELGRDDDGAWQIIVAIETGDDIADRVIVAASSVQRQDRPEASLVVSGEEVTA